MLKCHTGHENDHSVNFIFLVLRSEPKILTAKPSLIKSSARLHFPLTQQCGLGSRSQDLQVSHYKAATNQNQSRGGMNYETLHGVAQKQSVAAKRRRGCGAGDCSDIRQITSQAPGAKRQGEK